VRPYRPDPHEHAFLRAIGVGSDEQAGLVRGAGCGTCHGTGYLGRHGVYELLTMTAPVVAALNSGDIQAYVASARQQVGELSLAHHAAALLREGRTSVHEAMRSVGHVG
jgi:MSHA biogenesis protein MshE